MRIFLWILVIAVCMWPVAYFISHFCDQNFRDSAMGNLFATIVGVGVGVPAGLALNRFQERTQQKALQKEKRKESNDRLWHLLLNIGFELQNNREQLERLAEVLGMANQGRADMWAVALRVVDAFQFSSFSDLRRTSEFARVLPTANDLVVAYLSLERLTYDVRAGSALHDFYFSYGGGPPKANEVWKNVQAEAETTREKLKLGTAALGALIKEVEGDAQDRDAV